MRRHWEIAWSTLRPLTSDEVEQAVAGIARLGCSMPDLVIERAGERFVVVTHRRDDEFFLEFGMASEAQPGSNVMQISKGGLVEGGHIAWNWCCTGRRQPETGLIIRKWRQIQTLVSDKLLVWDDDGQCHWSWGSCPLADAALDPLAVVDAHLNRTPLPPFTALAS
jgi:hypothetical protein